MGDHRKRIPACCAFFTVLLFLAWGDQGQLGMLSAGQEALETPKQEYARYISELPGTEGAERAKPLARLAFVSHFYLKNYPQAERHYLDAIKLSDDPFPLRLELANLYLHRLADAGRAIAQLTKVADAPAPPEAVQKAWAMLGAVYSREDDYRRALDAYGKAVAAGPAGIVDLHQPEDEEQQKIPRTLAWTAPSGGARQYIIRYGKQELQGQKEFLRATEYKHSLSPIRPGQKQSLVLTGVPPGAYWFAVVSVDAEGRCSEISNSVEITLLPDRLDVGVGDEEPDDLDMEVEDDEIETMEADKLRFEEPPSGALAAECLMRIAEIYGSRLEDYANAVTAYKKLQNSRYLSRLKPHIARAMSSYAGGRIKWLEAEVKRREDTGWHKTPKKTTVGIRLDNTYYFPHENVAKVRIQFRSPHEHAGLSARLYLEDVAAGKTLKEVGVPGIVSNTVFRSVDISGLPVPELPTRKYRFKAEVLTDGKVVGTGSSVVFGRMRVPPSELRQIRELGIDAYGNLLVNGEPFIPLGYSGGPYKLPYKVRQAGFNWAMQHEGANFYTFKSTGCNLVAGQGGYQKFDLFTAVPSLLGIRSGKFAGEGVLSVTTRDEPNGLIQGGTTSERYFREFTSLTNLFLPENLVEINLSDSARLGAFEAFGRIGDYIFCEPWKGPAAGGNLTAITLAAARQSTKRVVPGMILMYPTWGGGFVALRCRYYCGLINGARAFGNFSANATFQHWDPYWKLFPETRPELFSLHRGIHEEIRLLTRVWAAPPIEQEVSVTQEPAVGLQFVLKKHNGHHFLFTANPAWKTTTVKFGLQFRASGDRVDVLFEERSIPFDGTAFSDVFRTCDVHVYRF